MEPPQKIVSLISSATEILFAIGVGERVVAVSHECDYPAEVHRLPRVTRSNIDSAQSSDDIDAQVRQRMVKGVALYEVEAERIAELLPDLIVTQAQCDVCAVRHEDVLNLVAMDRRLRHTKVVALNPLSLEDVFNDIIRIGTAVCAGSSAHAYVASLRQRVAAIASRTAGIELHNRPRTVCIEWIEPLMAAANWTPGLIELAGGVNALTRGGEHSTYCSWSTIIEYDPEVIVVAPCGFDLNRSVEESKLLTRLRGWHSLAAVKAGRAFVMDGNAYINRSGPRLVESLEILGYLLHPRIFADARRRIPASSYGQLQCE